MPSKTIAWAVHLFTASGAVLGVFALWEICRGEFARAAIYLLAALAIDSVDGTLARRVGVAERLPRIDGRTLDDVVDYLNYGIVPVVFLLQLGAFTHWSVAILPVLAASYGFAQVDVKTEDDFFLGWPSYWNIYAFYAGLWMQGRGPLAPGLVLLALTVLTLTPVRFVYPNLAPRGWRLPMLGGAVVWTALIVALLPTYPACPPALVAASLVYPAFYLIASFWLDGASRRQGR